MSEGQRNTPKSNGDRGNDSASSNGDKEKKRQREQSVNALKKGKDVAERARKDSAESSGTTAGANEMIKQNMINQIKLKLQQLQQITQNLSSISISSLITACAVTIIAAVSTFVDGFGNVGQRDDNIVECTVYIDKAMVGNLKNSVDENKLQRQTAKRVYSVLYYYGLRPEQCFAVLGNWKVESELDPTAVESIHDEPYQIGQVKQHAIREDFDLDQWNPSYAESHPLIERNGIGLGQWTNDRNKKLLEYAKFYGMEYFTGTLKGSTDLECLWYDLDVQLAFALDTSGVGDDNAPWLDDWKDIGNDEWDGDKNVNIPFSNIPKWSSQTEKNGVFDSEEIECHPVGENNDETTIGGDAEDEYYKQEDREKAIEQASEVLRIQWSTIMDSYSPLDYDWTEIVEDIPPVYDKDGNLIQEGVDNEDIYHDGVEEANEALKQAYIKKWKEYYRYYLYENTVRSYTKEFMEEWEGISNSTLSTRIDYALDYFDEWWNAAKENTGEGEPNYYVGSDDATAQGDYFFHVEEGYASGIMDVMGKTKDNNYQWDKVYKTDEDMQKCDRIKTVSRKGIAECAAMFAWPNKTASEGNNGTDLYKYVHDQVIEGDTIYMSCDRTVCTAVRWSGYDDNYPAGSTLNQIQYLVSSPRWVELAWGGDKNQLQEGDVLIRKDSVAASSDDEDAGDTHHTVIYIGEYLAKVYADTSAGELAPGACIVHGSYGERSPAIDTWNSSLNTYHAFRCIYPMGAGESRYGGVGYP